MWWLLLLPGEGEGNGQADCHVRWYVSSSALGIPQESSIHSGLCLLHDFPEPLLIQVCTQHAGNRMLCAGLFCSLCAGVNCITKQLGFGYLDNIVLHILAQFH